MIIRMKKRILTYLYLSVLLLLIVVPIGYSAITGPVNLWVAITTGNTNPVVWNVTNGTATLTDGGKTEFTIYFNVTDADGYENINTASAGVNVTFNGVVLRNNSGNCENSNDGSTSMLFTCIVVFSYYHNASTIWEINASATDDTGVTAHNDSQSTAGQGANHNLTTSSLSAFQLSTSSLHDTGAALGNSNRELTFVMNNTGNFGFTELNVTPFYLNASLTDFFMLDGNFTLNATPSTGAGLGKNMVTATGMNITDDTDGNLSVTLPHKASSEADWLANRTIYIYIDIPNDKGLSSGALYNASSVWEIWAE